MDAGASFGVWVKLRRRALRLTQEGLAQQVGCSGELIRKIEADARRPSTAIAERLAVFLGLPDQQHSVFVKVARAELRTDWLPSLDHLAAPPQFAAPRQRRVTLPMPLTTLIGRARELHDLAAVLSRTEVRLLTLTGAPGIGKTRLGIQGAATMADSFVDGVCFVALAPVSNSAFVASAIAQALGVQERSDRSTIDILKEYLRDRQLLLVLDNFEHLLVAAPLIADMLMAAPATKALVTSRAALRISGEHEFVVFPLALPDLDALPTTDALAGYAAIDLFVQRARATTSDFTLTDVNARVVADICVRLDGLPLAIELAASRLKLFPPKALLDRLEHRLAFLTTGPRDLPLRQQTLRETIDWSYNLLTEGEQTLFRRLSVFAGGFTLAAARAVCSGDHETPTEVVDGLASLIDKSLLQHEESAAGEPRLVMLETLREYALECLDLSGEAEAVRRQHAAYYFQLCGEEWHDRVTWLFRLGSEYDNLWAALAWSQTVAGDPEVALGLAGGLIQFWYNRSLPRQAIDALERTLNHPRGVGRTAGHAAAYANLGLYNGLMGNYVAAQGQLEHALSIAQEVGDTQRYAKVLHRLGWLAREQGDSATAWAQMVESLAIFRKLGDAQGAMWTLVLMAEVAILEEDPERAEALLSESRGLAQPLDGTLGWTLNHLGHAAQLRGNYQRAAELHEESLDLFQSIGEPYGSAAAYQSLGETALGLGRLGEAARWLAQGFVFTRALGDQRCMAWCLAGLGSMAALDENPERAARLWGAAERLRQALGCRPAPAARVTYQRVLDAARATLGDEAFAAAWAAGQAMTLEQAIAEALQIETEPP